MKKWLREEEEGDIIEINWRGSTSDTYKYIIYICVKYTRNTIIDYRRSRQQRHVPRRPIALRPLLPVHPVGRSGAGAVSTRCFHGAANAAGTATLRLRRFPAYAVSRYRCHCSFRCCYYCC